MITTEQLLAAYEKGLNDGLESAGMLCEKAYGYSTPQELARRIRALKRPDAASEPQGGSK